MQLSGEGVMTILGYLPTHHCQPLPLPSLPYAHRCRRRRDACHTLGAAPDSSCGSSCSEPRTDHDLDHVVTHLPLGEVAQDLHARTDPTQETRALLTRSCRLYRPHPATWARLLHKIVQDRAGSGVDLPYLTYLDHEVRTDRTDHLSEV